MTALSRVVRSFSTALPPKTPNPIKSLCNEIYGEANLKVVVEKFKKSSAVDRFRTKTGLYENTVHRLAAAKRFRWIEEILEEQKKYRDISREGFAVRIIGLYGKSGMFDNARKLFDELPELKCDRTVLSLNAILAACVNSKKFDMLEEFFRELPGKLSIEPDSVSYNIAMKGFCGMGAFDTAVSLLDEMEKKGLEPNFITFNTLLGELYGNGRFDDGEKIWQIMEKKNVLPNIRSYNAKLYGLLLQKKTEEAVEIIDEMKRKDVKPDSFSYHNVVKAFVADGNLEGTKLWYHKIRESGLDPMKATFATLIPFACDKGDLEFAFELSEDIFCINCPVEGTLLQTVVDSLVKESKIDEAKKIIDLGKTCKSRRYNLQLPSDK